MRPLVLVPSVLGSVLRDRDGRVLWGDLWSLYRGPSITRAAAVQVDGLLRALGPLDVHGRLLRRLRERELHVFAYDWRGGVVEAAGELGRFLEPLGAVDVIAVSTGGLVLRHHLAGAHRVARAIYLATPHRGSFSALSQLRQGVRLAPGGRRFGPDELAACQTVWDTLPHPEERLLLDWHGNLLPDSIYDPATWRRLEIGPAPADLEQRLARAAAAHRRLDGQPHAPAAVVIGSRHLPTLTRLVVRGGRATLPACTPRRSDPLVAQLFEPGDSSVPVRSMLALPGQAAWRGVELGEHHHLTRAPAVHGHILDALAA